MCLKMTGKILMRIYDVLNLYVLWQLLWKINLSTFLYGLIRGVIRGFGIFILMGLGNLPLIRVPVFYHCSLFCHVLLSLELISLSRVTSQNFLLLNLRKEYFLFLLKELHQLMLLLLQMTSSNYLAVVTWLTFQEDQDHNYHSYLPAHFEEMS